MTRRHTSLFVFLTFAFILAQGLLCIIAYITRSHVADS